MIVNIFRDNGSNNVIAPRCRRSTSLQMTGRIPNFSVMLFKRSRAHYGRAVRGIRNGPIIYLSPTGGTLGITSTRIAVALSGGGIGNGGRCIIASGGVINDLPSIAGYPVSRSFVGTFRPRVTRVGGFIDGRVKAFGGAVRDHRSFFNDYTFGSFVLGLRLRVAGTSITFGTPLRFGSAVGTKPVCINSVFGLCGCRGRLCIVHLANRRVHGRLRVDCSL